jgi:hypothetical protein
METRDPTQVRKFSNTVVGLRNKPCRVLTKGYLNLAAGIQVVAEELRANSHSQVEEEASDVEDE